MNTNDYIDSGILELYVMNALSPEEAADVERRAATDHAVADEIREIRESLLELDKHHTRVPRASVRASMLAMIEEDEGAATAPVASTRTAAIERLPARAPAIETSRRYLMAASWIVAVLGIGAAAYFAAQLSDVSGELAAVQREADSLRSSTSLIAHHAQVGKHAINVMHDSAAQIINLAGTERAPDSHLLVCYHPKSSEVHLLSNLPPPPDGKTYQLWALKGKEKIDAGTFDASRMDLIQTQKRIESVDAFAVTIENTGGSPTPDLDALIAVGKL